MAECTECGATLEHAEHFCGNCGAQQPPSRSEFKTSGPVAARLRTTFANDRNNPDEATDTFEEASSAETNSSPSIPSPSLDDSSGGMRVSNTSSAHRRGQTGGHQPVIKQLDPGTLLNGRYEIVRRIGGGGMGAVYLAKDRNL